MHFIIFFDFYNFLLTGKKPKALSNKSVRRFNKRHGGKEGTRQIINGTNINTLDTSFDTWVRGVMGPNGACTATSRMVVLPAVGGATTRPIWIGERTGV